MDIMFHSPKGILKDNRLLVSYDLTHIKDWEKLFSYVEYEEQEEGLQPSDLDPITQQIIICSHWFNIPELDDLGIHSWLIRQHILTKLDSWEDPVKPEELFKRHGLITDVDYLNTKQWFETKLYEICSLHVIEDIRIQPNKIYNKYIETRDREQRRNHLKLVKS
tara:strand:+ start:228 stop:719 length:492 start_codon:yes stop_codon:yes gene_type:complete